MVSDSMLDVPAVVGCLEQPVPHVIAVLDGRPGHEKQTLGITQALQDLARVRVTRVTVDNQSLLKTILQTLCLFSFRLNWGEPPELAKADLLIGTGSHTHLPMLLAKKHSDIPVVTCMTPSSHLLNRFDLCFIPEHDTPRRASNIIHTVGAPNLSLNRASHKKDQGLILLGGIDKKSHHWDGKKIVAMVESLVQRDERMQWVLSSSPRTPLDTVILSKKLEVKYANVKFYNYLDTPSGWVEKQYEQSSRVWVSSDSISMIYEALSAGCKVGLLPLIWKRKNCKFRRNEEMLVKKGLVGILSDRKPLDVAVNKPRELNEAQRCARIILEKWWPNSSQ
ncbi:MAG: mitochondrial fission ELM1 family protein [Desulforhopalus sp.]